MTGSTLARASASCCRFRNEPHTGLPLPSSGPASNRSPDGQPLRRPGFDAIVATRLTSVIGGTTAPLADGWPLLVLEEQYNPATQPTLFEEPMCVSRLLHRKPSRDPRADDPFGG